MHGQKRYGKRSSSGTIRLDDLDFLWQLISESQILSDRGVRGLRISVRAKGENGRELILEFPNLIIRHKKGIRPRFQWPKVPQRPKFSPKTVEAGIREAIAAGWNPHSRGKSVVFESAAV